MLYDEDYDEDYADGEELFDEDDADVDELYDEDYEDGEFYDEDAEEDTKGLQDEDSEGRSNVTGSGKGGNGSGSSSRSGNGENGRRKTDTGVVATGDEADVSIWGILLAASAAGFGACLAFGRRLTGRKD
jgi:hypothetical protein